MANVFVRHQSQTRLDRLTRMSDGHIARHNLGDFRFARSLAAQHHFARVIALGNDPYQSVLVHYEKRADVFLVHHLDRLKNHGVWRDRKNFPAFAIQDRADGATDVHMCRRFSYRN